MHREKKHKFSSSFAMFRLAFKPVWLCIMCASHRQFLCCDLITADLAASPKEKKKKELSSTEAFIYLFILNSDTQRACPRPHTSNKAVAADVFALRLVFRAVPVSQSRTISIKNPPRKKGLSAWQQDQVDTRCFLGKEFSGTPARAKRLSGPVYFNLFYQWLGLKVTQKTVFVLHVFVLKLTVESHKTRNNSWSRQTATDRAIWTHSPVKEAVIGEKRKKKKTSTKLSTNIWKHV